LHQIISYNKEGLLKKVIEEDLITEEKEIYIYEYEFMKKDRTIK